VPSVFDREWFAYHQRDLLRAVNVPLAGRAVRHALGLGQSGRVIEFAPAYYITATRDGSLTIDVRTGPTFARRLHRRGYPLWRALHAWDARTRLIPALNAGFDTLTRNPDPHPESTSVDGQVQASDSATWAGLRASGGSSAADSAATTYCCQWRSDSEGLTWEQLSRSIFLFDTSALTASATISAAVLSLFGSAKGVIDTNSPSLKIYTSAPASSTALAAGDFDSLGTTAQTDTAIAYASWSTAAYNDFTLNATGRGNISKVGISKFGTRDVTYDVGGTEPANNSDGSRVSANMSAYTADQTGTANDPKLVITYTLPAASWTPKIIVF
jgi:hypothetical protein